MPLTLYDRTEETWTHTPHPEGPLEPGDDQLADRPHLQDQMRAVADLGAEPQAWVATQPTITAVTTALGAVEADVVVIAQDAPPRLLERVLDGESVADKFLQQLRNQDLLDATYPAASRRNTRPIEDGAPSVRPRVFAARRASDSMAQRVPVRGIR